MEDGYLSCSKNHVRKNLEKIENKISAGNILEQLLYRI